MKALVTIFTPTYNRAYTIHKLYESLKKQTNKSFEWLIVDDGSTDDTELIINSWIEENNEFNIRYIYQENQGKHIAHNTGVINCETELFFCVDSDDYLLPNAVHNIYDNRGEISDIDIAGIVSIKINEEGKSVGTDMPTNVVYSSLSELYEKYKFKGDTALVFKTKILKEYKFPRIEGEKFIGEEFIYSQIDSKYKLYISNDRYYVYEYLEDGYTTNMFKLIVNNPKGYTLLKKTKLENSNSFKIKYKSAALYIVGGWISKQKTINLISNAPKTIICVFAIPLSLAIYYIRFKKIINNI